MIRFLFLVLLMVIVPSPYAAARDGELSFQEPAESEIDIYSDRELSKRQQEFQRCILRQGREDIDADLDNPSYDRPAIRKYCAEKGRLYYDSFYARYQFRWDTHERRATKTRRFILSMEAASFLTLDKRIERIKKERQ